MAIHSVSLPALSSPREVIELLVSRGGESYFGEPVTVLEHSLQAAHFAAQSASSQALIAAALMHDIGHLLHTEDEDVADHGLDTHHEDLGDVYLAPHFPPSVTEPIRLHVSAKRYLCAIDQDYLQTLSPSSLVSLGLQGGPMSELEAAEFFSQPYAEDGVALRRWDDEAKIPSLAVPQVETYLPLLERLWC